MKKRLVAGLIGAALVSGSALAAAESDDGAITAESFKCIREMSPVRGFFVGNHPRDLAPQIRRLREVLDAAAR